MYATTPSNVTLFDEKYVPIPYNIAAIHIYVLYTYVYVCVCDTIEVPQGSMFLRPINVVATSIIYSFNPKLS